MDRNYLSFMLQALLAAILFGVSAPLAKLLLGEIEPVPLAAFLYLGSGIGLLGIKLVQRVRHQKMEREARIEKSDIKWLAGAVFAGGVAAPIILLVSLKNTPASTASLLLNFEGVATAIMAFFAFKEAISARAWLAIALMTVASILLSINLNSTWGLSIGAVGILTACILWGVDNNFTRNISSKDPVVIVIIKGLVAGSFSTLIAIVLGNTFPSWQIILGAMILGSLSYGASIVLFIRAMRGLGAARTSALYGTAPLAGIILSIVLFSEFPGWLFFVAIPFMLIGTLLLVNDTHDHLHRHESLVHEHSHVHDDGHHGHRHQDYSTKRHSHVHQHEEIFHSHEHLPDIHHRHVHSSGQVKALLGGIITKTGYKRIRK